VRSVVGLASRSCPAVQEMRGLAHALVRVDLERAAPDICVTVPRQRFERVAGALAVPVA
jgi:hypothetical protein